MEIFSRYVCTQEALGYLARHKNIEKLANGQIRWEKSGEFTKAICGLNLFQTLQI